MRHWRDRHTDKQKITLQPLTVSSSPTPTPIFEQGAQRLNELTRRAMPAPGRGLEDTSTRLLPLTPQQKEIVDSLMRPTERITGKVYVLPGYMHYRNSDTPYMMLVGAVVHCLNKTGHVPARLHISQDNIPLLCDYYRKWTGKEFAGLEFAIGENLHIIPVYNENLLEPLLKLAIGTIERDSVIIL
jgi:hypothetical protein